MINIRKEKAAMEGKWTFTVHTFMGDMRSHYEFKVDGETLTGTAEDASNGAVGTVEKGTFKDNAFDFEITIKTAVGEMTNHLSGRLEGDKLIGKSVNAMGEFDCEGVRA